MRRLPRATAAAVTAGVMLIAQLAPQSAARAAGRDADYAACQVQDVAQFRTVIAGFSERALQSSLAGVDYGALVREHWRRAGLDQVIDRQVDDAIAQVRSEESWLELLRSLGSSEKAQRLASSVAERVYHSEPVRTGLEHALTDMGRDVGRHIEIAAADTAEPAARCMRAFLGQRYGSMVAGVVADETRKEFDPGAGRNTPDVSAGKVVLNSEHAITGAAILVARRQMARVAQRVGTRIVGSVLSRLVSVVAGGVGVVLIAKDIWDFRHGVMPIIASEMKSKASKEKVQDEIAAALKEQMGEQARDIAGKTADRVAAVWQEFRSAHAKVVDLSERSTDFKAFLETLPRNSLPRVDQMTALVLAEEGEAGLQRRIGDGSLAKIVTQWPDAAIDIAREGRSLAAATQWLGLAGDQLDLVAKYEIHRKGAPRDFTRAGLSRLLALDDRLAITRLLSVPSQARLPLYELETSALKSLARTLTQDQLAALGSYLTGLEPSSARRVLEAVSAQPQKMQVLGRGYVRDAILGSSDREAAVDMALRSEGLVDVATLPADLRRVLDGKVSPLLLWARHPAVVVVAAFFGLVLLHWVWRIVTWHPSRGRPSRERPTGQRASPVAPAGKT